MTEETAACPLDSFPKVLLTPERPGRDGKRFDVVTHATDLSPVVQTAVPVNHSHKHFFLF